jgi:hypothetical protein
VPSELDDVLDDGPDFPHLPLPSSVSLGTYDSASWDAGDVMIDAFHNHTYIEAITGPVATENKSNAFALGSEADIIRVVPKYFERFKTDHLLHLFDWSDQSYPLEIDGEVLVVPLWVQAFVADEEGWFVFLTVYIGLFDIRVTEMRILHNAERSVAHAPPFPLDRWARDTLRQANSQLLQGATSPADRPKAARAARSDSPKRETLDLVVRLREGQGLAYRLIGDQIGKSEATARKYYARAKAGSK